MLFKQYQNNLAAKKTSSQSNNMSHQYNKSLFTLSYLVSLQLRRYMDLVVSICNMRISDLTDPDILKQKQLQIGNSVSKFKKHFEKNLVDLNQREVNKKGGPKFTICFTDLAKFMGIDIQPICKPSILIEESLIFDHPQTHKSQYVQDQ